MKLVLDTNALWEPALWKALIAAKDLGAMDDGRLSAVLPCVAYAERVRQIRRDAKDVVMWKEKLAQAGVVVEPFDTKQAERLPEEAHRNDLWSRHARDMMVAAHVEADRTLVTADNGPAWSGLRRVLPADAARHVQALVEL